MGKFTKDQIEIMRKAYGTLSRMNPSSPTYKKFIKFLDKLPKDQLKQLAGANIKFVSMLAKNRLGENLVNVLEATYGQMLAKKGKKVKVSFVNGKPVIKVVPINPEPIDEAPIATRAILKQ